MPKKKWLKPVVSDRLGYDIMKSTKGDTPMKTRLALMVVAVAVASFAFAQELDEATVAKGAAFSRRAAAEVGGKGNPVQGPFESGS